MTARRTNKTQSVSVGLRKIQNMAYKRLLQLSRTTKVPITHPDFSDAYDDIWDGILRAYGLGMDETLKHIKELYPEGDVRPPMVGQTIDLEGEELSD